MLAALQHLKNILRYEVMNEVYALYSLQRSLLQNLYIAERVYEEFICKFVGFQVYKAYYDNVVSVCVCPCLSQTVNYGITESNWLKFEYTVANTSIFNGTSWDWLMRWAKRRSVYWHLKWRLIYFSKPIRYEIKYCQTSMNAGAFVPYVQCTLHIPYAALR